MPLTHPNIPLVEKSLSDELLQSYAQSARLGGELKSLANETREILSTIKNPNEKLTVDEQLTPEKTSELHEVKAQINLTLSLMYVEVNKEANLESLLTLYGASESLHNMEINYVNQYNNIIGFKEFLKSQGNNIQNSNILIYLFNQGEQPVAKLINKAVVKT